MRPLPFVLVPACKRSLGGHPCHVAGGRYVGAVRLAGALPFVRLLRAFGDAVRVRHAGAAAASQLTECGSWSART